MAVVTLRGALMAISSPKGWIVFARLLPVSQPRPQPDLDDEGDPLGSDVAVGQGFHFMLRLNHGQNSAQCAGVKIMPLVLNLWS